MKKVYLAILLLSTSFIGLGQAADNQKNPEENPNLYYDTNVKNSYNYTVHQHFYTGSIPGSYAPQSPHQPYQSGGQYTHTTPMAQPTTQLVEASTLNAASVKELYMEFYRNHGEGKKNPNADELTKLHTIPSGVMPFQVVHTKINWAVDFPQLSEAFKKTNKNQNSAPSNEEQGQERIGEIIQLANLYAQGRDKANVTNSDFYNDIYTQTFKPSLTDTDYSEKPDQSLRGFYNDISKYVGIEAKDEQTIKAFAEAVFEPLGYKTIIVRSQNAWKPDFPGSNQGLEANKHGVNYKKFKFNF